jgi:hypothetical protein
MRGKRREIIFLGSRERPERKVHILPPYVSPLSRECGILDISQSYRLPGPVSGIALLVTIARACGPMEL